jgi:hypothetical protein
VALWQHARGKSEPRRMLNPTLTPAKRCSPANSEGSGAMLDAKAYKAHFPDDPAYALPPGVPRQLNSAALMEALAALEAEFRDILRQSTPE